MKKPSGGWRYCTDFRKLNSITEKVNFPLPHITDSLRRFKSPKVFSSLDLLKGYYHIEVAESQKRYFAFSDGRRHLEYNRLPMGCKNGGSSMQALSELIFRGFPPEFLLAYLDDIILATPTVESHLTLLEKVLTALRRAGLKLHPKKCLFAQKSISALGFILSEDGITPDPANLSKIKNWPVPKNMSEVRQYHGLCSYYRSHLPGFATIAEPLTELLRKGKEWHWTDVEQKSFETLKKQLLSGAVCAYPDFDRIFILKCDAAKNSVGSILSQRDDKNKECIVCCASQKLNEHESKWATFDREFFALIYGVRTFTHYLRFKKFLVYTDHRPLLSCLNINTQNDATGRRTRWALELQGYEFDLFYKKGSHNTDADALSRHPEPDPPRTHGDDDDIFIAGAMDSTEAPLADTNADDDFVARLIKEQHGDVATKVIIDKLTSQNVDGLEDARSVDNNNNNKTKTDLPKYTLIDGILYMVCIDKFDHSKRAKIVVPASLIPEFLNRAHGDLHSGHPGEKRTFDRLSKFCVWPNMRKNVKDKVRTCEFCQASRPNPCKRMVPVKAQKASFPLEFVQADLVKFHPPSHGFDQVLVFEDRFTKYTCLYPISGKCTITVAKKFSDFVSRFGAPVTWGTDNGGEFKSRLIEALCRVYNTNKTFSLAHHPQSQGQCERKNRTIIAELSKRVAQYGKDWASQLPWIQLAYNTTPHTSTKFSPHMLMFGREARLPFQSSLPHIDTVGWDGNAKSYFNKHQQQLTDAHNLAKEYHQAYRGQMEAQAVKHGAQPQFKEGMFVWARIPTEDRHKLSLHFDGPWKITKVLGNTYVLNKDEKTLHRPQCDLKTYEPPKFSETTSVENKTKMDEKISSNRSKLLASWLSFSHILTGGSVAPDSNDFINPVSSIHPAVAASAPTRTNVSAVEEIAHDCRILEAPSADDDDERQQRIPAAGSVSNSEENVTQLEVPLPSLPPPPSIPSSLPPSLLPPLSTSSSVPSPPPLPPPPPPRLERELRRLKDFNNAGLRQMSELPAKRRRK